LFESRKRKLNYSESTSSHKRLSKAFHQLQVQERNWLDTKLQEGQEPPTPEIYWP